MPVVAELQPPLEYTTPRCVLAAGALWLNYSRRSNTLYHFVTTAASKLWLNYSRRSNTLSAWYARWIW